MFFCNIWPRQTFHPIFFGSVIEATGFAVLAWATSTRNATTVNVMMAIAGAGTGLRFMPNALHASGIWRTRIASVMALLSFSLLFGGTLAIAIMSSVFYNKFAAALAGMQVEAGTRVLNPHNTQSLQGIHALPPAVQLVVREHAARAVMWSFISVLPLMGLSVVSALMLGNVWISPKKKIAGGEKSTGAVIYSSYLLALFTVSLDDLLSMDIANMIQGTLKARKSPLDTTENVVEQKNAEQDASEPEKKNKADAVSGPS
jgi:hypothetical protein